MFGLGMPELIVVLVLALLVFGAKSLPEIGNGLGKAIRGFREATSEAAAPPRSPSLAARTCPHCGESYTGQAAFCPRCGNSLVTG
jgi:sec-independent protein translocase protein TatA